MGVTVNPIKTINVRINGQNPKRVTSIATFYGSSDALAEANAAIRIAQDAYNVATSIANTKVDRAGDTITGSLAINGNLSANNASFNQTISLTDNNQATTTLYSGNYTTNSLSQIAIDSFSISLFRNAKYEVRITSGASYHVIELNALHDGTNVWLVQYGEIVTTSSLGNFDADISNGNFRLLFTPTNANTNIKFYRNAIAI